MRRILLVTAASLLLAGCDSVSGLWDDEPRETAAFPPDAPVMASATVDVSPHGRAYCEATAQERADDAAAQGFEETVQQQVRQGVYADCVKWLPRR